MSGPNEEITRVRRKLAQLEQEKQALEAEFSRLEVKALFPASTQEEPVALSNQEKVTIFRQIFRGREDIFPTRWENTQSGKSGYAIACGNEWVRDICNKPRVKCSACAQKAFLPVTDDTIRFHLSGKDKQGKPFCAGVYPMLLDETCWFLAADFDKDAWKDDVTAFVQTCQQLCIPAHVERSRSGNGGHVWMFFEEPVPAADARKLGTFLLTRTMEIHPELGFASYDRLFPNQDTLPKGGLGNLIALPLQYGPRQSGNSVFVDCRFTPYADQWQYLKQAKRVTRRKLDHVLSGQPGKERVIGLPISEDAESAMLPWDLPPSRKVLPPDIPKELLPKNLHVTLSDQIYVTKSGLSPQFRNRLLRLAAFQNPEFYRAQAMRLPTFDKPRVIGCAENYADHIALPRGVLGALRELGAQFELHLEIDDQRLDGIPVDTKFLDTLTKAQNKAQQAILAEDIGVLSATTGFGKTVLASSIIAKRGRSTLILVHRHQLLDQWLARLDTFLDTSDIRIGHLGAGKRKLLGEIDVALMQSLVKRGEVDDCLADYGQLIVDECHHISAVSFELIARRAKAKYVLGLTATPYRKDGHRPIIFMQCEPIRHRVDPKDQSAKRSFKHSYFVQATEFRLPPDLETPPIQNIYQQLAQNEARNELIFDDVLHALEAGRSPVLLTERREHVAYFANRFRAFARNLVVLQGGMGIKQRRAAYKALSGLPDDQERLLIATGRYLGEGFDDARLDTLFLTMPISWKGTLAQYAGRLHRTHPHKGEVVVVDYADLNVPVLARMHQQRITGSKTLGYNVVPELPWRTGSTGS